MRKREGHWIRIRPCCERKKRRKKWSLDSPPSMKCDSFMRNMRVSEEEKMKERERDCRKERGRASESSHERRGEEEESGAFLWIERKVNNKDTVHVCERVSFLKNREPPPRPPKSSRAHNLTLLGEEGGAAAEFIHFYSALSFFRYSPLPPLHSLFNPLLPLIGEQGRDNVTL